MMRNLGPVVVSSGQWDQIFIESTAWGEFDNVNISNARVGIDNRAAVFTFRDVAIRNCDLGFFSDLNNTVIGSPNYSQVKLEFVRFLDSPLECHNSHLLFAGCKFANSDLDFFNCRIFVDELLPTGEAITPTRSAFYDSSTNFHSGDLYWVGFAYYDNTSLVNVSGSCDFVNICWSWFDGFGTGILLNETDKHYIFANLFDSPYSVVVQDGSSTDASQFRNNINRSQSFSYNSATDHNIEYWCNHHDDINAYVYNTPANQIDQGRPLHPANNIFTDTNLEIENADAYTYYWNEDNLATYPEVSNPLGFLRLSTSFPLGEETLCLDRQDIEDVWEGELCTPVTWWEGDECFDTCTLCEDCDTVLEDIGDPTGKQVVENSGIKGFSGGSDNQKAPIIITQLGKNLQVVQDSTEPLSLRVYNNLGQLMQSDLYYHGVHDVSLTTLASGIYTVIVIDKHSIVTARKHIFIP